METNINPWWHFFVMIIFSLLLFVLIIRWVMKKQEFSAKKKTVYVLALIVIVAGMLFGKYGANLGLPWWIYYPVPMLATVLLPPMVLQFSKRQTVYYLILSFLSAPFIHAFFSFFFDWHEYLPFWNIPYWGTTMHWKLF